MLSYGSPVSNIISDSQRRLLQRMQNWLLRGVLSANRYLRIRELHQNTGIEYFSDYIDDIGQKFYTKAIRASNLTRDMTHDQRMI